MIANVDGYIREIPDGAATLEFRSGDEHTAGTLTVRDADGNRLDTQFVAAEFNLPQRPWWERVEQAS